MSKLAKFFKDQEIWAGAVLIAIGLFLAAAGNTFIQVVIFILVAGALFLFLSFASFALFMGTVSAKWA